jgi:hypothetical protein
MVEGSRLSRWTASARLRRRLLPHQSSPSASRLHPVTMAVLVRTRKHGSAQPCRRTDAASHSTSLPSSPQAAKDPHLDQHTPPPHNRHASPSRGRHYHSASITSTAFSGDDDGHFPQPALTPYRPQPVRATPHRPLECRALDQHMCSQPRPVRSVSSAGSTPTVGSPQSPYSPPHATETLPRRLQYASPGSNAAPLPRRRRAPASRGAFSGDPLQQWLHLSD